MCCLIIYQIYIFTASLLHLIMYALIQLFLSRHPIHLITIQQASSHYKRLLWKTDSLHCSKRRLVWWANGKWARIWKSMYTLYSAKYRDWCCVVYCIMISFHWNDISVFSSLAVSGCLVNMLQVVATCSSRSSIRGYWYLRHCHLVLRSAFVIWWKLFSGVAMCVKLFADLVQALFIFATLKRSYSIHVTLWNNFNIKICCIAIYFHIYSENVKSKNFVTILSFKPKHVKLGRKHSFF